MKNIFISAFLIFSNAIFAAVPEAVITFMDSYNGHATIAGNLAAKPDAPLGVTIRNGDIAYATVTDAEGRWGIVIRHRSVNVEALSYNLTNPADMSPVSRAVLTDPNEKSNEDGPKCTGIAKPCTLFSKTFSCNGQKGCVWSLGQCRGVARSCFSFSPQASCNSQSGCRWQP